jgi:hypothetical protein
MRLLPANPTPASGSWTQSSGTCEVDQQYQPAFEMLGSRLRFAIGRTEFFPTRTMDNRQEWRAEMDAILPGNSVTITGENPGTGWTTPWTGSITVPPFVRVAGLEAQYRVRSDEAIRVAWTADALPNTSRVELRIYNSVFNEALRSFDQSAIRCEFSTDERRDEHPTLGSSAVPRASRHARQRRPHGQRDRTPDPPVSERFDRDHRAIGECSRARHRAKLAAVHSMFHEDRGARRTSRTFVLLRPSALASRDFFPSSCILNPAIVS